MCREAVIKLQEYLAGNFALAFSHKHLVHRFNHSGTTTDESILIKDIKTLLSHTDWKSCHAPAALSKELFSWFPNSCFIRDKFYVLLSDLPI